MIELKCSCQTELAWEKWLSVTRSRCHMHYELEEESIAGHIGRVYRVARETVQRIVTDLPCGFQPVRVLEIGASVGFNCLALAQRFPTAEVYSVEPDLDAVKVAGAMAGDLQARYFPVHGIGEQLPFDDGTFDLIICHTVIEHVRDVSAVVQEMSRVLAGNGHIHLEAPNYVWPYEPHLRIWCFPLLGKWAVKTAARLQGRADECWFVDHLKFVTPLQLTKLFNSNGLLWKNRVGDKANNMLRDETLVKQYKGLRRLIVMLDRLHLAPLFIRLALIFGLYPSVLYTAHKPAQMSNVGEDS